MVLPADTLNSRFFEAVIFVGPAQCGKTDGLILNWILFGAVVDPLDTTIFNPSHANAKDFSMRRVDRLARDSKAVKDAKLNIRNSDNKFDKHFRNGLLLTLSWPSSSELAGKPIPRVAITDYDRIDDDVDGEGSAFDLAIKRTTTFGSYAMCLAESSPSRDVEDPKKILSGHEAPPAKGIMALYNRGNRCKWYWPCPSCGNYFSPRFEMLEWDVMESHAETGETARMVCPHPECGYKIKPTERYGMQQFGQWLAEGQRIENDRIVGAARRSRFASFWLDGTAAAFITWPKLVTNYLDALKEFDETGSDDALKKFYNTDLGRPYVPKGLESERLPETLMGRAEPLAEKKVPKGVRFLLATVDVQKNMFVVQVHGIAPGEPADIVVVDRFNIQKSNRVDEDDDTLWVKPASYLEDWDHLIPEVIMRDYPLDDDSGRRMSIKLTLCDSGGGVRDRYVKGGATGSGGVTANAYEFVRKLRSLGLGGRFHLVRGTGSPQAPRTQIKHPDSSNSGMKAIARGDVPVLTFQSNIIKDILNARLDILQPGKGIIRFPSWLPQWFYQELCAEIRTDKGWEKRAKRNESWDLLYYCIGGLLSSLISEDKIDWNKPPLYAADWDENPFVFTPETDVPLVAAPTGSKFDFGALARELA